MKRLISRVVNLENKQKYVNNMDSLEQEHLRQDEESVRSQFEGQLTRPRNDIQSRNTQSTGRWWKPAERTLSVPMTRRLATRAITQVGFTAYLDHEINQLMPGQVIVPNQVLTNDGGGYNPNTGVFTAPVDGMYLFSFHFNSRHRHTRLRLVVDHGNKVEAISNPQNDYNAMAGNTVVLRVMKRQTV